MDLDVTIIPSMEGFKGEPLRQEMLDLGVKYADKARDYSLVTEDDLVMNFCGKEFLEDLPLINKHTKKTAFINCMTFLFDNEKKMHRDGLIKYSLYQRQGVLEPHKAILRNDFNSQAEFILFNPYFYHKESPNENLRVDDRFTIGRISRQDTDKFAKNTFHIWEYAVAPVLKRGLVLGYDGRSEKKTGKPPGWVQTFRDQNALSVSDFYASCDVIVQSTDTTENLPRIGFEAMHAGIPLVVDNRGGWKHMIEHEVTGFRCNTPQEFIYWTSRLAFEPELRSEIADAAKQWAIMASGVSVAKKSWSKFFNKVFK